MKILLIMPDGRIHKLKLGRFQRSFREAPLTLTTLAALAPHELHIDFTLVDKSVGQIVPFDEDFDLVGISLLTGTATEGYAIADHFRQRGIPVVLGGIHVTLMPEEAARHADTIVTGFAEQTWPQLLRDFSHAQMLKVYAARSSNIANLPPPRRDLQKPFAYMIPNTVFITRGCRGSCEFCSVPAAQYGWHTRPVEDVIDEIKQLKGSYLAITDVHLTADSDYAKELFTAMIPLRKRWGGLASTRVVEDPELLDLMRRSGCAYLLLGFESFNDHSLNRINKGFNRFSRYKDVVAGLHANNIVIQGCFIFGFDEDDKTIFEKTVDYVNEFQIDIPRYALYTPYPKTKLFKRLKAEGRLLHENWYYYDTQHVVIKPARMTPRELDEGFMWAYKKTFGVAASLKRSLASGGPLPVTFIGNLAYKIYIKRLYSDANRFPRETLLSGGHEQPAAAGKALP
ncbi:MAG: B12-binding domain-containing radical SAM protein [Deltaproteobacteria bacterium]|nr:B12-binding domain-containing radical SAM protein [Deltaproteobacteria bacterium]